MTDYKKMLTEASDCIRLGSYYGPTKAAEAFDLSNELRLASELIEKDFRQVPNEKWAVVNFVAAIGNNWPESMEKMLIEDMTEYLKIKGIADDGVNLLAIRAWELRQ